MSSKINRIAVTAIIAFTGFSTGAKAQVETDSTFIFDYDPIRNAGDTVIATGSDIIYFEDAEIRERPAFAKERRDKEKIKKEKKDMGLWRPDPKKALWLSIVLPGAGQIYNRKYWKLPIVYGGFMGCIYAMQWNNMMYNDYSQAYLDLMDNDPQTQSYNQFLHLGAVINESNKAQYENIFRRRKDYFRRYRDMSFFILVGVYALSVIDAYVDASLSEFDISPDLSMRIEPAVIKSGIYNNPLKSAAVGVSCSLTF